MVFVSNIGLLIYSSRAMTTLVKKSITTLQQNNIYIYIYIYIKTGLKRTLMDPELKGIDDFYIEIIFLWIN